MRGDGREEDGGGRGRKVAGGSMSCGEKWGRKGVRVEERDVGEVSVGDGAGG